MSHVQQTVLPDSQLAEERRRLVRLCARVTGDPAIAEDLAQETLLEAWRHADSLRNPEARSAWLSGIARNVCRRWARSKGRELSRIVPRSVDSNEESAEWLADDFDVELELERDELATLLDRAMELLPAETRSALMHRYVEDAPQALIAERLGLSEGAVAMRLSRGKLALRRVLASDLREDSLAFGLHPGVSHQWGPTRVWCSMCGVERLIGHFDPIDGALMLRCPGMFPCVRYLSSACRA